MKTAALPASLSSAEDVREAVDTLRSLANRAGDVRKSDVPDALLGLYDAGSFGDKESLRRVIKDFEDALAHAPRIGVTLAAPIDMAHKAELTAWFRTNVAPSALVQFGHNRALLGGMLVRAGSRIFDWSYRSRLLDSPVKFSEVLANVR